MANIILSVAEAERQRFYLQHPIAWFRDYLGIPPWMFIWSQAGSANPDLVADRFGGVDPYLDHEWMGMKDPLFHMAMSMARGERRTVIYSGTGVSKSFTAACLALWYVDTHRTSQWVAFAPKIDQIKKAGFFNEVANLVGRFSGPKGSFRDLHPNCSFQDRDFFIDKEEFGYDWSISVKAAAVTEGEDSATVAQGLHHENLVLYLEEYPGIKKAVRNALFKTLSSENNQLLVSGNPKMEGDQLQELTETPGVFAIHASPQDHPNIVLGAQLIPGSTSRAQVRDLAGDAAKALGLDLSRMEEDHPEYPTHEELADDPHYRVAALGLWPEMRTDTYIPAALLLPAKEGLVRLGEEPFRHDFDPKPGLPLEGHLAVLKEPYWKEPEWEEEKRIWQRRYIVYTDLAGEREVTQATKGDRSKADWHGCVVYDAIEREVVGIVHTRGPVYLHVLACLWLCDRFTLRYPDGPAEAAKNPSAWTGKARPVYGWERANEGRVVANLSFPAGEEARAASLIGPSALELPKGHAGWPFGSVRSYKMLYQRVNDTGRDVGMSNLYGVDMTGPSRKAMLGMLLRWAESIPGRPHIVRAPRLYNELTVFVRKMKEDGSSKVEHADGSHDDVIFSLMGCLQIVEDLALIGRGPTVKDWPVVHAPRLVQLGRRDRPTQSGYGTSWTSSYR